ncbi:hypothetical protein D7X48_05505 [bacterium D16-50]|nr:hypothetical protein D7X48_05505 [bacterium D16-50]
MAEIMKVFKEEVPAMRFIGKKYHDYGGWGEWFANGWFDVVESSMGGTDGILAIWENGGAYVGLERRKNGQLAEYWIGMFTPENTIVPEGFEYIDFPKSSMGTCWVYGKEEETHAAVCNCRKALQDAGMEADTDCSGAETSFENCLCPRFTTPDEKGNVILDYCYYIK